MTEPTPVAIHIDIQEPRDQTQVPADHAVRLLASASAGAENLGDRIRWRSNRDGFLGQGDDVSVRLTAGEHKIRAAVRLPKGQRSRSSKARSGGGSESESEDASTHVTVDAVPVDYSGGDT